MMISLKHGNQVMDTKVNDRLTVSKYIQTISDSRLMIIDKMAKVYSVRENKEVNQEQSFYDNGIYNGDILEIRT